MTLVVDKNLFDYRARKRLFGRSQDVEPDFLVGIIHSCP